MILEVTDSALADLRQVGNWIAEDNPIRAATFIDEILDRCRTLIEYSARHPRVARYASRDVHRMAYRDYLIFYRRIADRVIVFQVVHGAQDYDAILPQDLPE